MPRRATLALLLACTPVDRPTPQAHRPAPAPTAPATRPLTLPGITVDVPADFLELEPERRDALRDAALREEPGATIELLGVRARDTIQHGMIYVQTGDAPRPASVRPRTVRATLERLQLDLRQRMLAEGLELTRFEFTEQRGGHEGCFTTRMTRDVRTVEIRACARLAVATADRVQILTATCMADNWHAADLCERVLATRRFAATPTLPLDDLLPANATPDPLPGVTATRLGDLVFGATREQFTAACRKAGHTVDAVDWAAETTEAREWFTAGTLAQCSSLPAPRGQPFALGEVTWARVMFVDGKLAAAWLDVAASVEAVEPRLAAAYPEFAISPTALHHTIDERATGDELRDVELMEAATPGTARLHFVSARMPLSESPQF